MQAMKKYAQRIKSSRDKAVKQHLKEFHELCIEFYQKEPEMNYFLFEFIMLTEYFIRMEYLVFNEFKEAKITNANADGAHFASTIEKAMHLAEEKIRTRNETQPPQVLRTMRYSNIVNS